MSAAARFGLEVLLAWVMPWRAARTIAEQRASIRLLIRTLADVAPRRDGERHLRLVKQPFSGS